MDKTTTRHTSVGKRIYAGTNEWSGREKVKKMDGSKQRVLYLCDGEKRDCKKSICYKHGSKIDKGIICRMTEDINHALNFRRINKTQEGSFYEVEKVMHVDGERCCIRI